MIVPRAKTIDIDRRNRITSEPSTRIRNTWKILISLSKYFE